MTSRAEQELVILERISQILGSGLELEDLFAQVMKVVGETLGVLRASLVLRDEAIDALRIHAGFGLSDEEMAAGRYDVGEGVTGQVVASGQSQVVADISRHEGFLDRTGSIAFAQGRGPLSFVSVPIKGGRQIVGAVNAFKFFEDDRTLQDDQRLLQIIAGNISQAIRVRELVKHEKDRWLADMAELRENLKTKYTFDNIIGSSPAMTDVYATISQVASSRATVLLLGETGTGKELIAKAIHFNSPRKDKPFIRVNCGALSETLLESELFGHIKGAFTGAVRDKIGRFEAADGGTIFLDEIGTIDTQLQVKLLRVLQERELERVGDTRTVKVDVRVIAATNLDLQEEVRKSTFREDLYYRLNVVTIYLPPLRNRREDIPLLIDHFLERYNQENARSLRKINRELMNTLLRYPWPGNVRELENAIERAVVLSTSQEFTEELLPIQIRMFAQQGRDKNMPESIESIAAKLAAQAVDEYAMREGQVYELVVGEMEKQLINKALERNDGVKTRTADFLGINRNTLNKKVKELRIPASD